MREVRREDGTGIVMWLPGRLMGKNAGGRKLVGWEGTNAVAAHCRGVGRNEGWIAEPTRPFASRLRCATGNSI